MNFAAFGAGAGIFGDIGRRNMPGQEYAANEYAEKKEGWQEPGIFRNSPTPSFRKRP